MLELQLDDTGMEKTSHKAGDKKNSSEMMQPISQSQPNTNNKGQHILKKTAVVGQPWGLSMSCMLQSNGDGLTVEKVPPQEHDSVKLVFLGLQATKVFTHVPNGHTIWWTDLKLTS